MYLILTLGTYLIGGLSLWVTRRTLDGAYFRKHLRDRRWIRLLHIPTWAMMLFYTMVSVTAYTGFPVSGFQPGNFLWSSTYSVWNMCWFGSLFFSIPAALTLWLVPLGLWALTQRIPEKRGRRTTPPTEGVATGKEPTA